MSRTVNEKEYVARRNEILDVALRLVVTRGYEQMTIRDMLDELQISKGALYHYFSSKQAVLAALVERMVDEAEQLVVPIVHDPSRPGLEKMQLLFSMLLRFKAEQRAFVVALLRVWYTDDNAVVRQKLASAMVSRLTPLLSGIIQQGMQEGVFTSSYPEHTSRVILSLIQSLQDAISGLVLRFDEERDELWYVENATSAYTVHFDAIERVLGAPSGSLHRTDIQALREMVKAWVVSLRSSP